MPAQANRMQLFSLTHCSDNHFCLLGLAYAVLSVNVGSHYESGGQEFESLRAHHFTGQDLNH